MLIELFFKLLMYMPSSLFSNPSPADCASCSSNTLCCRGSCCYRRQSSSRYTRHVRLPSRPRPSFCLCLYLSFSRNGCGFARYFALDVITLTLPSTRNVSARQIHYRVLEISNALLPLATFVSLHEASNLPHSVSFRPFFVFFKSRANLAPPSWEGTKRNTSKPRREVS